MYIHINFGAIHNPYDIYPTVPWFRSEDLAFGDIWKNWKYIDLEFDVHRYVTIIDNDDIQYYLLDVDWDGKQNIKVRQSVLEGSMTSDEQDTYNETHPHTIFISGLDSHVEIDDCQYPPFYFPDEINKN